MRFLMLSCFDVCFECSSLYFCVRNWIQLSVLVVTWLLSFTTVLVLYACHRGSRLFPASLVPQHEIFRAYDRGREGFMLRLNLFRQCK